PSTPNWRLLGKGQDGIYGLSAGWRPAAAASGGQERRCPPYDWFYAGPVGRSAFFRPPWRWEPMSRVASVQQRQVYRLQVVVLHPHAQAAFTQAGFQALADAGLVGAADGV